MLFKTSIVDLYINDEQIDNEIIKIFQYYVMIIEKLQSTLIRAKYLTKYPKIKAYFNIISESILGREIQQYIKSSNVVPLDTPFGKSSVLYHNEEKQIFINSFDKALSITRLEKTNENITLSIKVTKNSLERNIRDFLASILTGYLEILPIHSLSIVYSLEGNINSDILPYIVLVIGYGKTGKSTLGKYLAKINLLNKSRTSKQIIVCSDDYNFLLNDYVIPFTYSSFIDISCIDLIPLNINNMKLIIAFLIPRQHRYVDLSDLYPIGWRGYWYLRNIFKYDTSQLANLVERSLAILKNKISSYLPVL